MMKHLLFLFPFFSINLFPQLVNTPLEINNYEKLTSYEELTEFIYHLEGLSDLLTVEVIGKSVEGRNLYALKYSKSEFGKDESKIKVLIFAQQHGNEQSGKEGALLLLRELLEETNTYLFDKIDLVIIPQMNPDGSEKDQRLNGNGVDLNRNHLILSEPETVALHKIFNKYFFEVTMDVHEYWPYGEEWKKFGYRKNFDVTVGAITNISISEKIRKFSYEQYLPFIFNSITEQGYSAFPYLPGGPPEVNYLRYSTYDINDGRQSFGIQNTFSFIQEGINGENYSSDNIEKRAESQMIGMLGLLRFCYDNKDEIKNLVTIERKKLIENEIDEKVAIQLDHFSDGTELKLNLFSYYSGNDTLVTVKDFRSIVKSLSDVIRPKGYLIPKQLSELKQWMDKHNLNFTEAKMEEYNKIEEYFIDSLGTIDFERDTILNPYISSSDITDKINPVDYYFLPVEQIKNNLIVIALEPKSILGLVTYKQFEHLMKPGETYPVLRVVN